MTWWCSATNLPWSWEWRAYPGVWIFVALLAAQFWRLGRVPSDPRATRRAALYYGAGLLVVWGALDWPLGTLGGGYLASAHSLQYVLLALAAPALLLLGIRDRVGHLLTTRPQASRLLRKAAHPLAGLAIYNIILVVTHFPEAVDQLMQSQLGSFAVDMAWLAAGCFLWWPVVAPAALIRVSPPLQMAYLFGQTVLATLPAAFLTFASFPLYRLYELAPRAHHMLTPGTDHQVAGLIMKVVGDPVIWIGIGVVFFRWATAERRADLAARGQLPGPALRA